MNLVGVDLNLLTALDALLEEASVTRAAGRLHLSQPAVSHALRRLRELLGDPLLVRTPRGLQPTPRARELRPQVRAALAAAAEVLQAAPPFDPATAERTFKLTGADQAAVAILPRLIPRLAAVAPGVRLTLQPAPAELGSALVNGDVELAIGVWRAPPPPALRQADFWPETFTCVCRRGGPLARGKLDLARYLGARHLVVAPGGRPGSMIDDVLARAGHARTIVLTVPQFLLAPPVIAATDLLWTAPRALARAYAAVLPLTLRDVPFAIPCFTLAMRWHVRFDRDPGLAWLRGELAAAAGG